MNPLMWTRASRRVRVALFVAGALLAGASAASAQDPGLITGTVLAAETGAPLEGVRIAVAGTNLGALSDARGHFRIAGVPAGEHTLTLERVGWKQRQVAVRVSGGSLAELQVELQPQALPLAEMVVTASREAQRRAETPATIHVVGSAELRRIKPGHPAEILNTLPGVWVNVTGGEGHMAAIRHPKTTNPVYLYLENGVPTRATGFFNHNALYEVNVPQADRIEVVKGPATALYGSDAIGGVINVLTRAPADASGVQLTAEAGAHGYARLLAAASAERGRSGFLAELNATRTDGWRDGTAYDRQSATLRWDHRFDAGSSLRSMVTVSRIDQGTAAASSLTREDYAARPHLNYTPISYRSVDALRASAAFERIGSSTLVSVTPFVRWNMMEMLPNWTLNFDPVITRSGHSSAGALLKVRRDLSRVRAIGGLDLDYSPGMRREWRIQPERDGAFVRGYTREERVYDYDVAFWSASPYLQLEAAPIDGLRLTGGLRYDVLGYDYETALEPTQTGPHRRPTSTAVSYSHLSPKLGAAYALAPALNMFVSYGHGFRVPSESQLFRQGAALSSLDLRPVRAHNFEAGAHGRLVERIGYEVAVYHMRKSDDLVTFTRADGSTETVNAGETLHRGVEVGVVMALPGDLRLSGSYTHARHTYEEWTTRTGVRFAGKRMDGAPDRMGSASLIWLPAQRSGASMGVEAQHIGPYWMDAANTHRYAGHTLVNVRGELPLTGRIAVSARVLNVLDARYAENTQYTAARGEELAPGMPRAAYIGVSYR